MAASKAKATVLEMHFAHERSTKGAHRFQECKEDGTILSREEVKIGTLYVRKTGMPEAPKQFKATIEY